MRYDKNEKKKKVDYSGGFGVFFSLEVSERAWILFSASIIEFDHRLEIVYEIHWQHKMGRDVR